MKKTEKPNRNKSIKMVSLFLVWSISYPVMSQFEWTKYADNPVLVKGPENWDIIAIGQPTIIIENDTIKMWYVGVGNDMKGRICYAISTDGINWTKNPGPVIDVGLAGEWDCGWLDTPEIVKNTNGYKMYYYGDTVQQFAAISSAIGMAYSDDGINWTKHPGNPVFTKSAEGNWDGTWIESPAVLFDTVAQEYKMWYNGVDTTTWKLQIGLATSPDGINWTRYVDNPVVSTGNFGQYDDTWIGTPAIIQTDEYYEMWYSSTSTNSYNTTTESFDTIGICYAGSPDGIHWNKHEDNPLFNTQSQPYDSLIDSGGPWAPDVIYFPPSGSYMMWFETSAGFMLATSPKTTSGTHHFDCPNTMSVYPNPCHSSITIEINEDWKNACVTITNASGKVVGVFNRIHNNPFHIDSIELPAGLYFIQIITQNKIITGKLIVE